MKKILPILLTIFVILSGFTGASAITVLADEISVNATSVNIYGIDSSYSGKLTIPNNLPQSFQIKVNGAKSFSCYVAEGESVNVSDTGLITPNYTTWYWNGSIGSTYPSGSPDETVTKSGEYGTSTVRVVADGKTFDINVDFIDYSNMYVDDIMSNYIKDNLPLSATEYDKLELACKFAAGYNYDYHYSSAKSMIINGGGDCWASTDAIVKICTKMGITCWIRNGNRDLGAGSGHMNAIAQTGDKYYILEAGYTGNAPRAYTISEKSSLFSYYSTKDGVEIYQYDGKETPKAITIPETIDGKSVIGISKNFISLDNNLEEVILPKSIEYICDSAFNSCGQLNTIEIPENVSSIGNFVFTNCNSLKNLTCADTNQHFTAKDGALYTKDMKTLLYAPAAIKIDVPDTVEKIEEYAFYHNYNLTDITVPDSVLSIGEGAFACCSKLENVDLSNSVKTIGSYCFAECAALKIITLPNSLEEIGNDIFNKVDNVLIRCYSDSFAKKYANDNNIKYDLIDKHTHTFGDWCTTKAASCIENGLQTRTCSVCGESETQNTDKTDHNYTDWTITKKATCTENGIKVCTCSICNTKQTASIKKTGHSYKNAVVKPTYFAKGYTLHKCTKCGYSYKDKSTKQLKLKKPTSVKAVSASKSVRLSWKKVSNASGYCVQKYDTKKKKWSNVSTTTKTSYTVTKLKSKSTYRFRISAYKKSGKKMVYSPVSATVTQKAK